MQDMFMKQYQHYLDKGYESDVASVMAMDDLQAIEDMKENDLDEDRLNG